MKLAFYYHITIHEKKGNFFLPGYLGVFIDALAENVESLYLVMHKARGSEIFECDFLLQQKNISWINIGFKTTAWHREIFHNKILKQSLKKIIDCDAMIIRSPSPLAPYFHKYLHHQKLYFMIVGDYVEGAEHLKSSSFRDRIIYLYLLYNDYQFTKRIKKTAVIVNSPALLRKYQPIAKSISLIRTTTLSANDFFLREDTCNNSFIELLYTGRIDPAKGLFELIEATALLRRVGINVRCNIVGWETDRNKPIEKMLISKGINLGINDYIIFHGKKIVGPELNVLYRMADVYIIPSYHEGFPRTIWEAMANCLPVIATNVGGIPEYLVDRENALLIKPHSAELIMESVQELLRDKKLRQKLIINGSNLANENTLKIQSQNIFKIISSS